MAYMTTPQLIVVQYIETLLHNQLGKPFKKLFIFRHCVVPIVPGLHREFFDSFVHFFTSHL